MEIVASPPKKARHGNDGGSAKGQKSATGKAGGGTVDLTSDDPEVGGGGKKTAAAASGTGGGPGNDGRTATGAGPVTVGAMARSLIAGMPGRNDGKRPAARSPQKSSAAAQSPSRSVASNRSAGSSRGGRHPVTALALVRISCNKAPSRVVTAHAVAAARSQSGEWLFL